jgi:prepilin-type N-terminal cleavage/methylation domain-containing protein
MRRTSRPAPRSAFTLVELLVVMTIIAILVALTAAAVVKSIGKADETKTRNEISQLAQAIQAFKTDFQASYIPDRLVLPPGYDPTGVSQQYISGLWPRIYAPQGDIGTLSASTNQFTKNGQPFALNGVQYTPFTYWRVPGNQPIVLQGYQTIVFFLGGSWNPTLGTTLVDRLGFSTNPIDPMNWTGSTGATTRKGPYFDFPTNRLAILASDVQKNNPFPGFIDVYQQMPYLYFSASKLGNDYSTTYNIASNPQTPQAGTINITGTNVSFALFPFQVSGVVGGSPPARFANANGFQIIAAGKNGLFGTGSLNWGSVGGVISQDGYDDMSNFHPTLLGIPAQ